MTLVVDRAAVDAEVARRRAIRDNGFPRWIGIRLGAALVAFYALAFLVRELTPSPAFADMDGWHRAVFFAVPFLMACAVTFVAERLTFGNLGLDAERLAARIGREVLSLTAAGWPLRTLRAALLLALGVGVPLGAIIYVTGRPMFIARASDAGIAIFVSGIVLACTALAFVLRALTLRAYRHLLARP